MRRRWLQLCMVLFAVLATAACASPSRITYIPDGASYTADGLAAALRSAAAPRAISRLPYEEGRSARQEALANLRKNGEAASALANTLTNDFPVDNAAVPYRVERGTFDGDAAWIVFESWGPEGGSLSYRRVWVFSADGGNLLAAQSLNE